MKILGIETSCDETAAAVVLDGHKILSDIVASSQELHKKTGGIIPEVAAREQVKCIIPVINEAISQSKHQIMNIDVIAVTAGPGLIGSLLIGVETAKTLAYVFNKPIIPMNHLLGHIYANWLTEEVPEFPAVCLIASGGHTEIILMQNHPLRGRGKLKWLGGTRDDAAGEAFDKVARFLDLGYPGGPAIAAKAAKFKIQSADWRTKITLPRPMLSEDNFDFSFSGLKTAVLKEVDKLKEINQLNEQTISRLAYEVQEAITDVLVEKTLRAAQKNKARSVLLGGGVIANQRLRDKFRSDLRIKNYTLHIPASKLCTDNAACIAGAAFFNHKSVPWQKINADSSLQIESR